jgi:hypothetical protein
MNGNANIGVDSARLGCLGVFTDIFFLIAPTVYLAVGE